MSAPLQAPAPAADPFESFARFIAAGHDPELDHWAAWEVAEYAASLHRAESEGGRR